MLKREDLLSINFYKKSSFTGSLQDLNFKIEKKEDSLSVSCWKGPLNSYLTPEEDKIKADFPFSEDGLSQAAGWLNLKARQED